MGNLIDDTFFKKIQSDYFKRFKSEQRIFIDNFQKLIMLISTVTREPTKTCN